MVINNCVKTIKKYCNKNFYLRHLRAAQFMNRSCFSAQLSKKPTMGRRGGRKVRAQKSVFDVEVLIRCNSSIAVASARITEPTRKSKEKMLSMNNTIPNFQLFQEMSKAISGQLSGGSCPTASDLLGLNGNCFGLEVLL